MNKVMDYEHATNLVKEYLDKVETEMNNLGSALPGYVNPNIKLTIQNDLTEEYEFGWVFYYNSLKFTETGDFNEMLAGNAPRIADKLKGILIETGTAHNTEYYITNYIKNGDPHVE